MRGCCGGSNGLLNRLNRQRRSSRCRTSNALNLPANTIASGLANIAWGLFLKMGRWFSSGFFIAGKSTGISHEKSGQAPRPTRLATPPPSPTPASWRRWSRGSSELESEMLKRFSPRLDSMNLDVNEAGTAPLFLSKPDKATLSGLLLLGDSRENA